MLFRSKGSRKKEEILQTVLVVLLTLATFLALFVFRSLDDNRLTSWQWVFDDTAVLNTFLILVIGIAIAYVLSSVVLPARRPESWLFISSFFVSAIFWREPEVIVDASRYFVQAKHLEIFGIGYFLREWGEGIMAWTDLPLIPFLYGLIFRVFGEARENIQLFSSLLFSGTVVLTYLIGKTLWDETVGVFGGLLLLGMPYLLTQVPLMLVDVPAMFFFALAMFVTIKAVRNGGVTLLILAAVTITLAMLSKYSVWLMLSVIPVIFLAHFEVGKKVILGRAVVVAMGTVLLIGSIILWKYEVIAEQLGLLQSYQLPGLRRWGESFTSTFFFQIHPYVTVAALISVWVAVKKRDFKYPIIAWLLFLVVLLGIKRSRYLIVVLPMLALMASYGLREIRNLRVGKFVVSSAVVSGLAIAIFGFLPFLRGTSAVNLMQAGSYLDTLDGEVIEVVTLPQPRTMVNPAVAVPILDLYTRKTLVYRYDEGLIPRPKDYAKSSLRFTWELENPGFLVGKSANSMGGNPVAIIGSDRDQSIPAGIARKMSGYRLVKELATMDNVFRYKTTVRVYQPA